jgi:predicted RNase H-like nuclease (RuvC/YqgF family)
MPYVSKKRAVVQREPSRPGMTDMLPQSEPIPRMPFTPSNVSIVMGKHDHDIKTILERLESLDVKPGGGDESYAEMSATMETVKTTLDDMTKKVTAHDALDKKLGDLAKKVTAHDALDKKLGDLAKKVTAHDALDKKLGELAKKVDDLEKKLADMQKPDA